MKIIIITSAILIISLLACSKVAKMKKGAVGNDDLCGGIPPPMSVVPFWDLPLSQARSIALRRVKTQKGYRTLHHFIALITEEEMNDESIIAALGFDRKKDAKLWEDRYFGIVIKSHSKDAKSLINQYNIQGFPVTIEESRSVDGEEIFSKVTYGQLPQVSGSNEIDSRPIIRRMYDKYKIGEKDKNFLLQLRDHIDLLELGAPAREKLYVELTNDYLNQFTAAEWSTYAGYRLLKKELKDVRFDVLQLLLKDRDYYNQAFQKIILERKLKNGKNHDADWIIGQAILKSFQKVAREEDDALFEAVQRIKDQYEPGHMTVAIAKAILKYQIKKGSSQEITSAAFQYFNLDKNWYSAGTNLLEASAKAVNEASIEKEQWEQAERWIARAIEQSANPTRYRLQADLLKKLERHDEYNQILEEIDNYKSEFDSFKNYYPILSKPISLKTTDITKKQYEQLESIPTKYKIYYDYIAREGSIYKKGQAIEPIALLNQNDQTVELLTRVHLVTGSILPVTHFRSYYIRSVFSNDGGFLRSEYVFDDVVE